VTSDAQREQERILGPVLDHLKALGVPYFITGSIAGRYHGVDRSTHDADIVFDARHADFPRKLADRIGDALYVDVPEGAIRQFNVIAADADFKVDFWPIGGDPFARSQLERRQRGRIFNRDTWIVSIEDLLLSKLRWYAQSGSEIQRRDLDRLLVLHRDTLDRAYFERWADDLGLREHLNRLLGEIQ